MAGDFQRALKYCDTRAFHVRIPGPLGWTSLSQRSYKTTSAGCLTGKMFK